jgi:DNA-directed RNA polymerase specialized sigma24 family protein
VVAHAVADLRRHDHRHPGGRGSGDTHVQELLDNLAAEGATAELADELDRSLDAERRRARQVLERVGAEYGPDSQTWRAFLAVALEGRPAAEVAAALGMTKAAVYMARARVLDKLRQALEALPTQEAEP